ncbi:inactive ribonuclease-like protein 9 [Odocoileus virginianus]|uniref:Inactive ribonuclease-like protein 9 n=1 Tax=Odocoileus virginianus TaxID=9874 RepID=A0A6J0XXM6_ODOVR
MGLHSNRRYSLTVDITPSLLCFLQGNMGTLINMQPLFLLFLLLKPLQFVLITNGSLTDKEFEEHLDGTGPTRAPTKELFKAHVIVDSKRPLHDPTYCSDEMKIKNAHHRLYCVKEHFFLQASHEDIHMICHNTFVSCGEEVEMCYTSKKKIEAVHCVLTSGIKMLDCEYTSSYEKGWVFITCRWQNDIREVIPESVVGMLTSTGKVPFPHHS